MMTKCNEKESNCSIFLFKKKLTQKKQFSSEDHGSPQLKTTVESAESLRISKCNSTLKPGRTTFSPLVKRFWLRKYWILFKYRTNALMLILILVTRRTS